MDLQEVEALRSTYKRVLESKEGKEVYEDLKKRFFYATTTFSQDPHEIAYNEGQRTVMLFLEHMISDQSERQKLINQQQSNEENIE